MDTTAEQRAAFGSLLRRLRESAGLTPAALAALASPNGGIQRQNIEQWERGKYAPREPWKVEALDEALNAGGALLRTLGLGTMNERLVALEERADLTDARLDEILRLLDGR